MNFAVVHNRVQSARKHAKDQSEHDKRKLKLEAGHTSLDKLSHLEEDLNLKPVDPLQAQDAVEANEDAPLVEGVLKKRAAMMHGFGPTVWHDRYILLDPREGLLSYWESALKERLHIGEPGVIHFEKPERPNHAPKRTFMLSHIIQVESNHRHRMIQLMFCKAKNSREVGKVLQLQAATESEFRHWLQALQPYGMRQGPTTPTRKSQNGSVPTRKSKSR